MKFNYILIITVLYCLNGVSQNKQSVLFSIDTTPFYTQEFLENYNKNTSLIADSLNSIDDYLELFINYKLKVKEAKELKLDTLSSYINELKDYKARLVQPFLKDKKVTAKLVKEAYKRLQKEINASHILVSLKPTATPQDTLTAYTKLLEARKLILNGTPFSEVAKQFSDDPSAQHNGGNLGFFTALQMVYPFENAAYTTAVNSVSKPFRTQFGFHILQVHQIRPALGEVEVAHIMVKNNESNAAKSKIDSIYKLLLNNKEPFSELALKLSDDRATASKGGKLGKFTYGQMVEAFSKVAFELEHTSEISKPFKTEYGWHIIKLLKKYPVQSFDEIKDDLTRKIERDERSNLIGKSVIDSLQKKYTILVDSLALNQFKDRNWRNLTNVNTILLTINEKEIRQVEFAKFLKLNLNETVLSAFEKFKEQEVLNYYKETIEFTNAEFASTYNEFKDGLLLFDLLEKNVWEKSKDSTNLSNYFIKFKDTKYANKELESIKGSVIGDYQNYLEDLWIKNLHKKYKVKINKSEKKRLTKLNQKKS
ncbi:peptidylprolyl isomerase [Lutibacter sp. A80]|uniref:peptidylprolyl isomerase n=1 Tax=Lutibacter sp. A80 TaxID=2918453 RepID=UPI001F06E47C|nr:peptidylprolyl isomerase [Lutibacter sp. A80]UMB60864.1 peptidylprolyl isomerase [Lutibacter sp. A80]